MSCCYSIGDKHSQKAGAVFITLHPHKKRLRELNSQL